MFVIGTYVDIVLNWKEHWKTLFTCSKGKAPVPWTFKFLLFPLPSLFLFLFSLFFAFYHLSNFELYQSLEMSSNSCCCNASKPSSWVTEAQDLQKTIRLFVILYILYLMRQILLGWLRHKQRLQQIQAR